VLGSVLLLIALGYLAFIWGRLPGHFDPNRLMGKGPVTGEEFACGWDFRHSFWVGCSGWEFFSQSMRVFFSIFWLPLWFIFGSPFFLLFDRDFWPIAVFVVGVYVLLGYFLYQGYKKKLT
jgi:hypothetical protein